jgi:hypothetical protein
MNSANRHHIFNYVNNFFLGDADYAQWLPVPKKGDLSDPNNLRGIMLMDVCSKISSLVMNK